MIRRVREVAAKLPLLPEFCRWMPLDAAKLPLSGKIMRGVFCGVIRDAVRGMGRVSVFGV